MSRIRRASALAGASFALGLGLALAGAVGANAATVGANAATTTTTTNPDGSVTTCSTDTIVWEGVTYDVSNCTRTPAPPVAIA